MRTRICIVQDSLNCILGNGHCDNVMTWIWYGLFHTYTKTTLITIMSVNFKCSGSLLTVFIIIGAHDLI